MQDEASSIQLVPSKEALALQSQVIKEHNQSHQKSEIRVQGSVILDTIEPSNDKEVEQQRSYYESSQSKPSPKPWTSLRKNSQLDANENFYQKMLNQKKQAIAATEEEYNRKTLLDLKKHFVERKLCEKENELFEKISSEDASLPQIFNEYFNFKYDIYKWRLETQVKQHLVSNKSPLAEEDVSEKLKYDLGTPILVNTLAQKIHTKLVDTTASVLAC